MHQSLNRQWLLVKRPVGHPKKTDFEYREVDIPEPGDGEILLQILYALVDPAQRGWMQEATTGIRCHLGSPYEVEYLQRWLNPIARNTPWDSLLWVLQDGKILPLCRRGAWIQYLTMEPKTCAPSRMP